MYFYHRGLQNKFIDVEYKDSNGCRLFSGDDLQRLKFRVNRIERKSPTKTGRKKTPGI